MPCACVLCACTRAKVRCVKRVLGQPWAAVQSLLPSLPFVAGPGPSGSDGDEAAQSVVVRVGVGGGGGGAWVSPVAVAAAVAQELRLRAEAYLNDRAHRTFSQMANALRQDQG
jgi:uncharacterized spore protein YtfJ